MDYKEEGIILETSSEIDTGEKVETTVNTDREIYHTRGEIEAPNRGEDKIYIRYPRIVNYTILEYGIHSDREDPAHYLYLDILKNRTLIFIYGGKKPFDCHLSVEKVVEHSEGNITLYIKEICKEDPVVTSPYIVVEIEGVVENISVIYIH
ncbi:hypothetical protein KKP90_01045 [Methanothermococcus sp. SCGC AD-155-E23]|nr:hypothetical protein [Methanothermococcus sp. SCGC AD-155-E23]